jgi:predicted TPR repeat methyltransferase
MSDEERGGEHGQDDEEITIDQALALAGTLMGSNDLQNAAALAARILEFLPEQPQALNIQAIVSCESGDFDKALAYARRATAAAPDDAAIRGNLGNILLRKRDSDGAIDAYERSIELGGRSPDIFSNLGVLIRGRGDDDRAEEYFRRALALDPDHGAANHNLSGILARKKQSREAMDRFWTGVLNTPFRNPYLTALAYDHIGRRDKAVELFSSLLERDPDNPELKHMLASFSGEDVPDRASDAFVEKTFDRFAELFEHKLRGLAYKVPQFVAAALAAIVGPPKGELDILDAGCGTGLCGPLLRPYASRLTGVDLSGGMLAKAGEINIYDELVKAELTAFLDGKHAAWDVVVLADTLCYFGPLEAFAAVAATAVRPAGVLIFTVEALPQEASEAFRMDTSSRYQHAGTYVDRVLAGAGFELLARNAETLRMESVDPVAGFIVSARRRQG